MAYILRGTAVLLISKLYKNCTAINLAYINAKYFPIQLLGPAEKGINEYASDACNPFGSHLSGLKISGF